MSNEESSPFTPGYPAPVELFVGRRDKIEELMRYINQTVSGRQENVFLIGDRGIGKSSVASFLRYFAEKNRDMIGVHVFLGGVTDLDDVVCYIFEEILKKSKGESWFGNIKSQFGNYIKEVGLFGISVSFKPPRDELRELTKRFPEALHNMLDELGEQKKGLFIALDDINGLAKQVEFANWYKSFVDKAATHYGEFRVFIMLIGLPEVWDTLLSQQPSLTRIFRVVEIERLLDVEVKEFFSKAFRLVNKKVDEEAMKFMVTYSGGLPIMMHEIGDAAFWHDEDGIIDKEDALEGVMTAAERIGRKYLDPKVYRAIRSKKYKSILRKSAFPIYFTKKDIEKKLDESEKKVLNNFLTKMKELGIIEQDVEGGRGTYRFVNSIYPVYIWIESQETKRRGKDLKLIES
jgi:hypothetical protein